MDAEKRFVTKYKINGEEYIGWIYASNIDQARGSSWWSVYRSR